MIPLTAQQVSKNRQIVEGRISHLKRILIRYIKIEHDLINLSKSYNDKKSIHIMNEVINPLKEKMKIIRSEIDSEIEYLNNIHNETLDLEIWDRWAQMIE